MQPYWRAIKLCPKGILMLMLSFWLILQWDMLRLHMNFRNDTRTNLKQSFNIINRHFQHKLRSVQVKQIFLISKTEAQNENSSWMWPCYQAIKLCSKGILMLVLGFDLSCSGTHWHFMWTSGITWELTCSKVLTSEIGISSVNCAVSR